MEEEANILSFKVYVNGPNMTSMSENRMYYPEIFEGNIFSPGGYAPVLSYTQDSYTDTRIVYTVNVDAEKYKTLADFSIAMRNGIMTVIKDRKIRDIGTFDDNGTEAVGVDLEYSYTLKDLGADIKRAELQNKKQALIDQIELAKFEGKPAKDIKELEDELKKVQRLELSMSPSAAEKDLSNKALQVEEGEEPTPPQPVIISQPPTPVSITNQLPVQPEKETVVQQTVVPQPVPPTVPVVPPAPERSVVSLSKDTTTKESNLISSILNTIRSETATSNKDVSREAAGTKLSKSLESQIIKTIVTSVPGLLQKELERQASSIVSSVSNAESAVRETVSSIIPPGGLSGLMNTLVSSDSSIVMKSGDTRTQEGLVTTINDSIKFLQASIQQLSSDLSSKTSEMAKILNVSSSADSTLAMKEVADRSNLIDQTLSTERSEVSMVESLGTNLLQTMERSNLFSEIQKKVVDIESTVQNVPNVSDMFAGIGDTIKSAITNMSTINTTSAEVSTPTTKVLSTRTESAVNETDQSTANLGTQNIQSIMGGSSAYPTVVSLSQNTIDSLASAIIKNMSIAPFLNSGR